MCDGTYASALGLLLVGEYLHTTPRVLVERKPACLPACTERIGSVSGTNYVHGEHAKSKAQQEARGYQRERNTKNMSE